MEKTANVSDAEKKGKNIPPQKQAEQPGKENQMHPVPECMPFYPGVEKFKDQVILITGGDSGIGRAVALAFANEGAHIAINYKDEHEDAAATKQMVENFGVKCLLIPGDLKDRQFCFECVEKTIKELGRLDTLINNAAEQWDQTDFTQISEEQLE